MRRRNVIVGQIALYCGLLLWGSDRSAGQEGVQTRSVHRNGFSRSAVYPAGGTTPSFIGVSDLTADGVPDLIVVNKDSATVATLTGAGDGSFQQAVTREGGADPRRVVVADLNEDKIPDLIVMGYFAGGFTVWLGAGNGNYLPGTFYGLIGHGNMLAVGDFNGDGHLDVAAESDGSGKPITMYLFLGNGAGGLSVAQTLPTPFFTAFDIDVADMNGDAKPDVILATGDPGGPILIFRGTGAGEFAAPIALPPLSIPSAINDGTIQLVCVDVNGDGRPDLIVGHLEPEMISVRLNRGNNTFDLAFTLPTSLPADIAVGDINRDGRPDLVIANFSANTVSYALNLGGGRFQVSGILPVGDEPKSVVLADFNRDGWLDIAVANSGDSSVTVWLNGGGFRPRLPVTR
jgi:hypothetical protein